MRRSRDEEDEEEPVAILALGKEHLPTCYQRCPAVTCAQQCYQRCLPALPTSG